MFLLAGIYYPKGYSISSLAIKYLSKAFFPFANRCLLISMQVLVCQYAYYGQCGYLNGLDGVGSGVLRLDDHGKLVEDGRL
jgi:hypothetical protein